MTNKSNGAINIYNIYDVIKVNEILFFVSFSNTFLLYLFIYRWRGILADDLPKVSLSEHIHFNDTLTSHKFETAQE